MKEEMDRAQAELNALKRTEEDLKKGHQKLEEMVTRLDQEVVSWDETLLCIWIFLVVSRSMQLIIKHNRNAKASSIVF